MAVDKKLLSILVCPIGQSDLTYDKEADELICVDCKLAFPVKDDIPIMLAEEARQLSEDELP